MKTAVSVPDELFARADEVAERLGLSRSEVYARALEQFLDSTEDDEDPVTAALNEVADHQDPAVGAVAARALVASGQWEW